MYHSTLGLRVIGKKEEGRSKPARQSWEDLCLKHERDEHALRRAALADGERGVNNSNGFNRISAKNGSRQGKYMALTGLSVSLDSSLGEASVLVHFPVR